MQYQETITTIKNETEHMTQIVEDLLLLTKAENNCLTIKKEIVDINKFISKLFASINIIYSKKQIHLEIIIDPEVKQIFCSTGYLSISLKNILLNAAKHSPKQTKVLLHISKKKDLVLFRIQDHGEGISSKDLPHIFQYFYREDTARNRVSGGVGIGLSLAMAFVSMHSGNIKVSSKKGIGSTFTISIPHKVA